MEILSDINRSVAQKSLGTPAVAVKIHTQAASLYMPQGAKHGKKVAACSPAITVMFSSVKLFDLTRLYVWSMGSQHRVRVGPPAVQNWSLSGSVLWEQKNSGKTTKSENIFRQNTMIIKKT